MKLRSHFTFPHVMKEFLFPLDGLLLILLAFQCQQEKQGLTELKFYPVTFPKIIEFLHANGCATFSKA